MPIYDDLGTGLRSGESLMQIRTSQHFGQRQSLVVTAQLQRAIHLLQMSNTDLQEFIGSGPKSGRTAGKVGTIGCAGNGKAAYDLGGRRDCGFHRSAACRRSGALVSRLERRSGAAETSEEFGGVLESWDEVSLSRLAVKLDCRTSWPSEMAPENGAAAGFRDDFCCIIVE